MFDCLEKDRSSLSQRLIGGFGHGLPAIQGIYNPGKRIPIGGICSFSGKLFQNGSYDHEFTLSGQKMGGFP